MRNAQDIALCHTKLYLNGQLSCAGGDPVQPVQGCAVLPCEGYGALQPGAPHLLLVPGGAGLEGSRLWGLGPSWHACAQLLPAQIRFPRGKIHVSYDVIAACDTLAACL